MDEDDDVNFVLDNIFDVIFLIDIFVNFFTAYVGPEDNVIKNRGVSLFYYIENRNKLLERMVYY